MTSNGCRKTCGEAFALSGDVRPYDIYAGSCLEVLERRQEVKIWTFHTTTEYNGTAREQGDGLQSVH